MSEGEKLLKNAQQLLKCGLFKKPKPEEAYIEFENAAKAFQIERRSEDSAKAYQSAADIAKSCQKFTVASLYLSNAIEIYEKELKVMKQQRMNIQISECQSNIFQLQQKQIDCLQRAGQFTDAARVMLQASRNTTNKDDSQQMLENAISTFEEENKPAQALQSIDAAMEDALSTKDFAAFHKLTTQAFKFHKKLGYGHKSDSLALTLTIIATYIGDNVLFEQALSLFDSYSSDEFKMAEQLENAFKNTDSQMLKEAKAHDGKLSLTPSAMQLLNELKFTEQENVDTVEDVNNIL